MLAIMQKGVFIVCCMHILFFIAAPYGLTVLWIITVKNIFFCHECTLREEDTLPTHPGWQLAAIISLA